MCAYERYSYSSTRVFVDPREGIVPILTGHDPNSVLLLVELFAKVQDARLNYFEQHVERLGYDSSKLENLRVSASNASPMADTLDLCARYTDAASLDGLVPRLTPIIRRGIGLNTR